MKSSTMGICAVPVAAAVYFLSFFPACSVALRQHQPWPTVWTFYEPIPIDWKFEMLRFWMKVDPRVRIGVNELCPLD